MFNNHYKNITRKKNLFSQTKEIRTCISNIPLRYIWGSRPTQKKKKLFTQNGTTWRNISCIEYYYYITWKLILCFTLLWDVIICTRTVYTSVYIYFRSIYQWLFLLRSILFTAVKTLMRYEYYNSLQWRPHVFHVTSAVIIIGPQIYFGLHPYDHIRLIELIFSLNTFLNACLP
jgi:hypothetical protein